MFHGINFRKTKNNFKLNDSHNKLQESSNIKKINYYGFIFVL